MIIIFSKVHEILENSNVTKYFNSDGMEQLGRSVAHTITMLYLLYIREHLFVHTQTKKNYDKNLPG